MKFEAEIKTPASHDALQHGGKEVIIQVTNEKTKKVNTLCKRIFAIYVDQRCMDDAFRFHFVVFNQYLLDELSHAGERERERGVREGRERKRGYLMT